MATSPNPPLVRDLMTVGVATCPPDTPLPDIARLLIERDLEAVDVLDPIEGHALGVVSQDELVKAYTLPGAGDLIAENVMREAVPQVPPDIPLAAAAQIMRDLGVRVLFLMHHSGGIEYPAASLSYRHLLRHLCASGPDDLKDLGLGADRQSPVETFIRRRDDARTRNKPSA